MKKILYLSLAIAAMMAVGCNKEKNGSGNQGGISLNDGDAYVKIGINLPTTPSTKANDDFNDGEDYEYAVEDAVLVIFAGSGTDENATTLRSAYELKKSAWAKDDHNAQITTSSTITQRILTNNIASTENAYALVILNIHDFFKVEDETLKIGSTALTNETFADFSKRLLDESDKNFSNQSFTMTNMPHLHTTGGTSSPTVARPNVLMKIEKDYIYASESAANAGNVSAEIDVERVVAKVGVKYVFSDDFKDGEGNTTLADKTTKLSNLGWFIDNTNKYAFVVRNTAEPTVDPADAYNYLAYYSAKTPSPKYRMASAAAVHTEPISGNKVVRTYWGIDPNYNVDATDLKTEAKKIVDNKEMVFNADGTLKEGRLRPGGSHYYCAENTFDVDHQTVKNTTRVVLAAQFNNGVPFFTLSSEPNTIRSAEDMADYVEGEILARVNMINWLKDYFTGIASENITKLLDVVAVPATYNADKSVNVKSHMTVALNTTAVDSYAVTGKAEAAKTAWTSVLKASQEEYITNNIDNQLSYYNEGVAYYQVLIKHFGDEETPWTESAEMTNEIESIYGSDKAAAAHNFLGRYGVLRNNWYDITVTGIRQIGTSTVPELTDIPDDNVDKYIKVKINIMPWAKRTQSIIL